MFTPPEIEYEIEISPITDLELAGRLSPKRKVINLPADVGRRNRRYRLTAAAPSYYNAVREYRAHNLRGVLSTTAMIESEATIQQLFAETLRGDYEDDAPWAPVRMLRQLGTREVFDIAADWCTSEDPLKRARGIDVLAQLGKTAEHPKNAFPEESYAAVINVLGKETNVRPLNSAISGLGHLDDPAAIPLVVPFHGHEDRDIRFSVAFALGCFPNDPLSVETLLALMNDSDAEVRDWGHVRSRGSGRPGFFRNQGSTFPRFG